MIHLSWLTESYGCVRRMIPRNSFRGYAIKIPSTVQKRGNPWWVLLHLWGPSPLLDAIRQGIVLEMGVEPCGASSLQLGGAIRESASVLIAKCYYSTPKGFRSKILCYAFRNGQLVLSAVVYERGRGWQCGQWLVRSSTRRKPLQSGILLARGLHFATLVS